MYVVEITSNVNGVIMRGENYAPDLRKAFDKALRNIERQIKRHKEYLKDKVQMKTHDISFGLGEILAEGARQEVQREEEDEREIVKIKKFPLRPMSPKEATMQMDLLGHNFFVFRNAEEDDDLNVVYRRRSGGYGLIIPQS
jgi:putative sigma-54 modulation protein